MSSKTEPQSCSSFCQRGIMELAQKLTSHCEAFNQLQLQAQKPEALSHVVLSHGALNMWKGHVERANRMLRVY